MKGFTFSVMLVLVVLIVSSLTLFGCSIEGTTTTTATQTLSVINEVKWNLSGAVMPQPKYGLRDISGSEKVSVLTVVQTEKQIQITGEMSNLSRDTLYAVLLAKGYTPNTAYPGLFTDKIGNFTFMSTLGGSYRWTFIIFNTDFPGPGTYTLSIWINDTVTNTTILISDNFDVTIK